MLVNEEDDLSKMSEKLKSSDDNVKLSRSEQFETKILEDTINKIGGLLAVGFGEAGSEIIAKNMQMEGDINPMIQGRKIVAIFGFCDIRQFTDTTECLKEEVMLFVNTVGFVVHLMCDR